MPKKIIFPILALVIIVTMVVGGFFLIKTKDPTEIKEAADNIIGEESQGTIKESTGEGTGGYESNTKPIFTADITDLSKVSYITSPVTVQGGDLKTHGWYFIKLREYGEGARVRCCGR